MKDLNKQSSLRAIFYDTETTGISSQNDRIIELAAFVPETGEIFESLIHPGCPIPPEATKIHHITDDMVKNAPSFSEAGAAFTEFCGENALLIAHNNDGFDLHFLREEYKRNSLSLPAWKYLDTLKWARRYRPDLPRHALQYLREIYGVEENNAHRALDDVLVLHKVFSYMIDDLSYDQVYELMNTPRKIHKMPFGKHQGKALQEIPKDYITWLKSSGALDKEENSSLKFSLESLI